MAEVLRIYCLFSVLVGVTMAREGAEINSLPLVDQCGMVSELQSSIIRIMSAHYEYGKGIHNLHTLANHLRQEVVNLRLDVDRLQKETPTRLTDSTKYNYSAILPHVIHYMKSFFNFEEKPSILKKYHQFAPDYLSFVGNISEAIDKQIVDQNQLLGKVNSLRRQLNKAMKLINKVTGKNDASLLSQPEPTEILLKELAKSRQTKDAVEKRLAWLEENVHALRHQRHPSHKLHHADTGCAKGFYRHSLSCYKFINRTDHWVNAEKYCQKLDPQAHLVSIENKAENDFLVAYRKHNSVSWTSQYLWTGGSDMFEEGTWTWVATQQSIHWTNWMPGEPANHNQDQHCVYMRTDGDARWDDWHCYAARLNFVCEIMLHEN